MPIEFYCTQCNRLLRTPDDSVGKQAKCPECSAILVVPPASTANPRPETPVVESNNPYQAPTPHVPDRATAAFASSMGKASPASRVAGPAIALIVTAGIGILMSLFFLALNLLAIGVAQGNQQDQFAMMFQGGFGAILGFVRIAVDSVTIVGAIKMKNLSSYNFAMAGAILAMIPCINSCCLLTMPFGIWALVVLQDNEVRQAFISELQGRFTV